MQDLSCGHPAHYRIGGLLWPEACSPKANVDRSSKLPQNASNFYLNLCQNAFINGFLWTSNITRFEQESPKGEDVDLRRTMVS